MTKQKATIGPFAGAKMTIYGYAVLTDAGVNCYLTMHCGRRK